MTTNHDIDIDLFNIRSISKAIRQVEKFRDKYDKFRELLLQRICEKGIEIAQLQIVSLDATFTGELLNSFSIRKDSDSSYAIVNTCTHAAFVEFGTGDLGMGKGKFATYTGELPSVWEYQVGKTIHHLPDGRYGWFYPIDGKKWVFTEGMESRPFMYNTAQELGQIIKDVAKEVFENAK